MVYDHAIFSVILIATRYETLTTQWRVTANSRIRLKRINNSSWRIRAVQNQGSILGRNEVHLGKPPFPAVNSRRNEDLAEAADGFSREGVIHTGSRCNEIRIQRRRRFRYVSDGENTVVLAIRPADRGTTSIACRDPTMQFLLLQYNNCSVGERPQDACCNPADTCIRCLNFDWKSLARDSCNRSASFSGSRLA